ncbi:hypothetical protein BC827DRAFT_1233173 [Russula dissimulans]|nr:hypothetical protein BC827DRAFT_1233173 [Russula dissimulans]
MNVDFLGDTSAHRYAYESDEEDQLNPLSRPSVQRSPRISIQGNTHPGKYVETVIIASGEVGKAWAQGIQLGKQHAAILVDDSMIGLVYLPSLSDAAIIVSEASGTLPTWAMRPYAEAILSIYKPKRILLLDSYPVPTYISSEQLEAHRAPVRYLSTRGKTVPSLPAVPFSPPNLIQSTSAAFTSAVALPPSQTEAILLLLPSQRTPIPRGNDVSFSPHTSENTNGFIWSEAMMRQVHECLVVLSGVRAPVWQEGTVLLKQPERRRSDIGDGGMYL